MGYLVSAHLLKERPDAAALKDLPHDLRWRTYHDPQAAVWLVDLFTDARSEEWPFTHTPFKLKTLNMPQGLELLDRVLTKLRLRSAAPFKFFELNRLLSERVKQRSLSVMSDDDGCDVAVLSRNGEFERIEVQTYEAKITWIQAGVEVQPLAFDADGAEPDSALGLEAISNMADVRILSPGEASNKLHNLAYRRERDFLSGRSSLLDLGSFDCLHRVPKQATASGR